MKAKELKELLKDVNDDAEIRLVYSVSRKVDPLEIKTGGAIAIRDNLLPWNQTVYLQIGDVIGYFTFNVSNMLHMMGKENYG